MFSKRQSLLHEFASAAASGGGIHDALGRLESMLRRMLDFEEIVLFLKDPATSKITCFSREGVLATPDMFPDEENTVRQIVERGGKFSEPFFLDISGAPFQAPDSSLSRLDRDINSCLLLPLQGLHSASGVLGLYLKDATACRTEHAAFFQYLAFVVGTSIESVIQRDRFATLQSSLAQANTRLDTLRTVSHTAVERQTLQDLVEALSGGIQREFGTEILCLVTYRPEKNDLYWAGLHLPDGKGSQHIGRTTAPGLRNGASLALRTKQPHLADRSTIERTAHENCISVLLSQGAQTYFSVPLFYGGQIVGVIVPAHVCKDRFSSEETSLWEECAEQVSLAVECLLRGPENQHVREQIPNDISNHRAIGPYVVQHRDVFSDIVGNSAALKRVFSQVELVAPLDSPVLIVGETGTGKGLLAQAIHALSGRKNKPFVQINCASIPRELLESEMFGYEKGAYTGAVSRRIGRIEQANGGTLFLDEIGEMCLELQPKLLRVVQEQCFERLGSNTSVQVDVRFIWATNRDLKKMVDEKQFRRDLFYRLSVFPISVPALSERVEDVPLLVQCFLQEFNRKMNKEITHIPCATMDRLLQREWPGNIRELRNVIERAVILSPGPVLEVPAEDLNADVLSGYTEDDDLIGAPGWEQIERDSLLRVLRETGGCVAWAANKLQLKRTTLDSRLRRLGISADELRALRKKSPHHPVH